MANTTKNKQAQLKIQQMAFVLVAIVIFFVLVSLVYFSIRMNSLKKTASSLEDQKVYKLVQKLSSIPELRYAGCASCVDMDKAILLKNRTTYQGFFGLDYLSFEILYPKKLAKECSVGNYPDCNKIILINTPNFGTTSDAFASLCRYDQQIKSIKCELGIIHAASNSIK
jgi:hypothetical protein